MGLPWTGAAAIRHAILRDLGESETRCLLARDDEAFTYNKRINRLAAMRERYMIVRENP